MSDEPTRRLSPQVPPRREPYPPPEYDHLAWHEELRDRIRSLTSALVLVGILAVLALGIGVWALLTANDDSGSRGASSPRVRDLEDRVEEIENDVERAATRRDLSALEKQVETLEDRVKAIEDRAEQAPSKQDLQTLQDDLQELQQRVDDLEQQGGGAPP